MISVHVDFVKIILGNLALFKAVPITFIAIISSFSILGQEKKNYKSNMYCEFFSFSSMCFVQLCIAIVL